MEASLYRRKRNCAPSARRPGPRVGAPEGRDLQIARPNEQPRISASPRDSTAGRSWFRLFENALRARQRSLGRDAEIKPMAELQPLHRIARRPPRVGENARQGFRFSPTKGRPQPRRGGSSRPAVQVLANARTSEALPPFRFPGARERAQADCQALAARTFAEDMESVPDPISLSSQR